MLIKSRIDKIVICLYKENDPGTSMVNITDDSHKQNGRSQTPKNSYRSIALM